MRRPLLALVLSLFLAAPALAYTPAGDWTGTWISTSTPSEEGGNLSLTLYPLSSTSWSGTYIIYDTFADDLAGSLSATASGGYIYAGFTIHYNGYSIPFSMSLPTAMGNSYTGYWQMTVGSSIVDYGTFTLYRQTPAQVTVTVTAGTGGTVSPAGVTTLDYYGDSPAYSITPNAGYAIADVQVNGFSIGTVASCSFPRLTSNTTLHAEFKKQGQSSSAPTLVPILNLLLGN